MILALPLLGGVAASQQNRSTNDIESARLRCGQVTQLARMLQSANMVVAPEIRTADDGCGQYLAALRNREFAKSQQALAHAVAVLDQLNLTAQGLFTRLAEAVKAVDPLQRFYALPDLAKEAFNLGHPDQAQTYARELLQEAPQHPKDWNYGNAIYDGYFVLGRVALQQGNVQLAGQYLLDASTTPGSPQLNSFGPNVMLAKELLEKGQGPVVLQFFAQCKKFWEMDRGKLDEWSATIRGGGIPQFSQNLNY
jgi:hypothetical protein